MSDEPTPEETGAPTGDESVPLAEYNLLKSNFDKQQNALKRIQAKNEKLEKAEQERLEKQSNEGTLEERLAAMQKKFEDAEARRQAAEEKLNAEVQTNTSHFKKDQLRQRVVTQEKIVRADGFEDWYRLNEHEFSLDDDRKVTLKEKAISVEAFAKESVAARPYFKATTQNSGGGVPEPGGQVNGGAKGFPANWESLTHQQKVEFFRNNPGFGGKEVGELLK